MIDRLDNEALLACEAAASLLMLSNFGANQKPLNWQETYQQIFNIVLAKQRQRLGLTDPIDHDDSDIIADKEVEAIEAAEATEAPETKFTPEIRPNPNLRLLPVARKGLKRKIKEEKMDEMPELEEAAGGPPLDGILNRPTATTVPISPELGFYDETPSPSSTLSSDQKNLREPRNFSKFSGRPAGDIIRKNLLCVRRSTFVTFINEDNRYKILAHKDSSDWDQNEIEILGRYAARQQLMRTSYEDTTDAASTDDEDSKPFKFQRVTSAYSTPYLTPSPSISPEPDHGQENAVEAKLQMYKTSHFKKVLLTTPPVQEVQELSELQIPHTSIDNQVYVPELPSKVRRFLDHVLVFIHKKKIETIYAMNEFFSINYKYNPKKSRIRTNYADPKIAFERTKNNIASRRSRQRKKFQTQTLSNCVEFEDLVLERFEEMLEKLLESGQILEQMLKNNGKHEWIFKARQRFGIH